MFQERVKVLWNTLECSGYYRIGMQSNPGYSRAKPGQFVMVRFPDEVTPLLRRPFSIHRLILHQGRTAGIELLYKVVGTGTEKLSLSRKGDGLDLLGPLGTHFKIPENTRRVFIVAGGIGVAPMFFLSATLEKAGVDLTESRIFIGGRSRDDLLCMNDFISVGMRTVHLTTEDGSAGLRDLVTTPLERAVAERAPDRIYACGPLPMIRAVAKIARRYRAPCQVSIESLMACGLGACLGCAVEGADPGKYLHACIDGPVFEADRLNL